MRWMVTVAAAVALGAAACSQAGEAQSAAVQTPSSSPDSGVDQAKAAEWIAAPVHPAEPPVSACSGSEDPAVCAADRDRFRDKSWPAAWKGDVAAARAVAYCLTSSCDGAVLLNPVQGCAWREVVVASGDAAVTERDADDLERTCAELGEPARGAAKAKAAEIFREVYGRDLGASRAAAAAR